MSTGTVYQRSSDGKWVASLQLDGKRKTVYAKDEKEARRKLAELQGQVAVHGAPPNPGRKTVDDLLGAWLETCKPTLKPRTHADYEALCRRYIRPILGTVRLSKLTPDRVQRLYNSLQAQGLERAPAHVHAVLHRACKLAVLWRWLPENPCDHVLKPSYAAPRKDVWAIEELGRFLAGSEGHWLQPLWVTAVATGCRLGELMGLRWTDVALDTAAIAIRRTLQRINGAWVESQPKTKAGERTITLPPEALAVLRRQRAQQLEWRLKAGPAWVDGGLVFTDRTGRPLYACTVAHEMRAQCQKLGLPKVTPHGLRHLHASLLLNRGLPVPDVSKRLGHANPNITMTVYAHVVGAKDEAAAQLLQSVLRGYE